MDTFLQYTRTVFFISLAAVFYVTTVAPASAKAHLVAVIVLRSTASARGAALKASKALALRVSQQPGWEARVVDAHGRSPADAAAGIGAEVYIIGQYVEGNPAHVSGSAISVATDARLSEFSYTCARPRDVPQSVSFQQIVPGAATTTTSRTPAPTSTPAPPATVSLTSGDLISVLLLSDIGSRISQEGDTFAVVTAEDYYYKGQLVLPKGSPGYGVITHLKRAGSFHAGGELNFTVKRIVTPSRTDVLVETNGATADADKTTEGNGNAFGQYLLWGVGMFAKRGNDILIKKGTMFHVSTLSNANVPVASGQAQPAQLDPAVQVNTGQVAPAPVLPAETPTSPSAATTQSPAAPIPTATP